MSKGEQTFLLFYYSGHGLQDAMTLAACNEDKNFPIEKMIRILATIQKSYIVAVFDCCRQKLKQATRGGAEEEESKAEANNLVLTFGCQPDDTVPERSTIAVAFFEKLRSKANAATGEVSLPFALTGWRGIDKKAEVLVLTDVELKLSFKNWEPRELNLSDSRSSVRNNSIKDIEKAMAVKVATMQA